MIILEMIVYVVIMFAFSLVEAVPHVDNWSYKANDLLRGPHGWHLNYPACAGRQQSPIEINKANVVYDPCLRQLDFSEYKSPACLELSLENYGGHTAKVRVSGEILLKGGGLSGMYGLDQIHFHWGSEHSLNGKLFPLEVHLCHLLLDCKRKPVTPIKLTVVAFFVRVGPHNQKYEQLLRHFDKIRYPGNKTWIPTFPLYDLLPVARRFDYYRYQGSLTTPPCSEAITWSVGVSRIFMSREQMERFRTLFDNMGQPMVDNTRPIQALNGRTVYTNNYRYGNGTEKGGIGAPIICS